MGAFEEDKGVRLMGMKAFWIPLLVVTAAAGGLGFALARSRADLYELRLREAEQVARLGELRREQHVPVSYTHLRAHET